ncbi:MAG TPA: amidohydrolase family protein [Terracidiphilus sp.]|jgi:predicted TIM-barrel fold metal-dependent hydrolase|nr:amidohydrolase family protein [Terracidiphilus sp.]
MPSRSFFCVSAFVCLGVFSLSSVLLRAQNTGNDVPPVIDVHVHAMDESFPGGGPMCPNTPKFLASDPDTKEAQSGWVQDDCTPKLYPSDKGEYLKDMAAEMRRLNVTAVVFGDPRSVQKWTDAMPGRVIPGTSFNEGMNPGARVPLDELRKDFTQGGFKVMGEIGLQYEGLSPSDPSVDQYFALAEELDIPIAIHMGTGGSGRANVAMPKFRGSMGNPLLLEELLARHPKLRVQVMHAGYPMIDNMLTLLQANSHVYVDVAGLIWSYPIKEVNRYIERLVDAGFEDRVMFGTDQMEWPKLMSYSISIIQNADYLTPEQKRDILYNNAVRFLRLNPAPRAK